MSITNAAKITGIPAGLLIFIALAPVLWGCSDADATADTSYTMEQPANFPKATYTFENNPVTKEGFELGRMLFYDTRLSGDSTISCSTCHIQQAAFADPAHRVNLGVANRLGTRNTPALTNVAFQSSFFWDGGSNHLDFVPVNALTSHVEMDNTMEEVVRRLRDIPEYQKRFKNAFNKEEIDSQQLLHALSQFMVMFVSANAKYDKVIRGEDEQFSAEELAGYDLFIAKCSSCHATDLFTDGSYRNNGLDTDFKKDSGRSRITELPDDLGKFKVPSLRNVTLTPPYMHDGRFQTLEQVLSHYASQVKNTPTVDPALRSGDSLGIPITDDERVKIIAFIKTLTDHEFGKDKRFADPF
jgi:cytochrome c peroxidase